MVFNFVTGKIDMRLANRNAVLHGLALGGGSGSIQAFDIEERLVDLGNKPVEVGQRGHSRNVWDLQTFQGKAYIGMGSTVVNAGPIPIWSVDHVSGHWSVEPEASSIKRRSSFIG